MTLAKHWVYNKDEDIVLSNLKGLCYSNPTLGLISSEKVVFNTKSDTKSKVCIVSGGGAGHEPLHGGYVGENLLDAAVSGSIFASPSTKQIMAAIKTKANKEKGTLIVVKNYTGDILHFGLVVERAKSEGYKVEMLAVTDDVAVGRKQNAMVGRRGLAGTAIVHKIVGGSSKDFELSDVSKLGRSINDSLVTLSAALDRTSVPGKSSEELEFTGDNAAELGLGIHNEPGTKISPIPNIDNLIKDMFHKLLSPDDEDRHYVDFQESDDTVLVINNIGGTSSLELYAITEHVMNNWPLKNRPSRVLISDFVTSLNSPGFSITLLNLTKSSKESGIDKSKIIEYLDLPTNAPGWKPKSYAPEVWGTQLNSIESPMNHVSDVKSDLKFDGSEFESSINKALKKLIEEEPKITHFDTLVGDGDCGETLVNGAQGILKAYKDNEIKFANDPVYVLSKFTEAVEDSMGGTSGGIYSIYLTALVHQLQQIKEFDTPSIAQALHSALYDGLFKYTKARVGGRTLVDTLQPFVDTLKETNDIQKAIKSAKDGCESTKKLQAKFGRASYVDEKEFEAEGGIPDPGAVGLLAIIEGFFS
ncbi:dihydroxyacetone kinase 1 [[Candida] jaroonii]|uniref:Dihydroxyacetone kinase 1 n=1 Tax=[Candida] jaroonii TaxID=467808 RepID=A0ACA9YCL1_9ASCO|nr:dihydroxyacetone kinase 1 [[Candida] jaroonii]